MKNIDKNVSFMFGFNRCVMARDAVSKVVNIDIFDYLNTMINKIIHDTTPSMLIRSSIDIPFLKVIVKRNIKNSIPIYKYKVRK